MWRNLETPIEKFLNTDGWYVWANMKTGSTTQTIAQSLDCFIPGKTLIDFYDIKMIHMKPFHDVNIDFKV